MIEEFAQPVEKIEEADEEELQRRKRILKNRLENEEE